MTDSQDEKDLIGQNPTSGYDSKGDRTSPQIIDSETLLAGHREVWIRHGEEMYRLRLTASGRLYLSK